MEKSLIKMAALGRNFQLGTLYDYTYDCIIPGDKIQPPQLDYFQPGMTSMCYSDDEDSSPSSVLVHPSIKERMKLQVKCFSGNRNADKWKHLKLDHHLQASVAANLINKFAGASKYSQNDFDVMQPIKVVRFQLLLKKDMLYEENIPETPAGKCTHVVTRIRYGVQAFCVFSRSLESDESKEDVEKEFELALNKFIYAIEDGENKLDLSEFENSKLPTTRFYGDLHENPRHCSISEAFNLIVKLKRTIEQNPEKAIPVTVWLKPLDKTNLLRDLDDDILNKCIQFLDAIARIKLMATTALKSDEIKPFLHLRQSLQRFVNCLGSYAQLFGNHLGQLTPLIRSGKKDNEMIIKLLDDVDAGLFQPEKLDQWFQQKQEEIRAWRNISRLVRNRVPLIQKQEGLDAALYDATCPLTVVLLLPKLDEHSQQLLETMKTYVNNNSKIVRAPLSGQFSAEVAPWYSAGNVRDELLKKARRMFQQVETNMEDCDRVSFIMTMLIDGPYRPAFALFKEGQMINKDFQLPSSPTGLRINLNKSVLEWDCEYSKDIDYYLVQYCKIGEICWISHSTNSNNPFVGLGFMENPYGNQFRVAAVSLVGRSPCSSIYQHSADQKTQISNGLQLEIPKQDAVPEPSGSGQSPRDSSIPQIQVQHSVAEKFQNLFD